MNSPKMDDANVARHVLFLEVCCLAFACALLVLPWLPARWSKSVKWVWFACTVGASAAAVLYLLYTGTSARGFLD